MNLIVSILIAVGYMIDYSCAVVVTVLYVEKVIDLNQKYLYFSISKISLSVCIFLAYIILMKVFITYQN